MQAVDTFEGTFARRLRAELDGLDVRTPAARPALRHRRRRAVWRVARPLALAMAATIAFAGLATAATGSPDPGQWLRLSQWTSHFNPPVVTPSDEPAARPSPSEAAEPSEKPAQSPDTEREPSDSPSSGQHPESPEPSGSEGPTSGPSPGEGGDG
ncbi:MAG TPA: hypothetical protein VFL29_05460 [Candidatus Dormibacteraeota bacterium]|nr:hypothetical protein [Candidatus Dormibacteraeota bacterium]